MDPKIIVHYSPEYGSTTPDGQIVKRVEEIIEDFIANKYTNVVYVGSEIILIAFRVAVKEGKLRPKDIVFRFKNQNIQIDKNGECSHYPEGFMDFTNSLLMRLI